MKPIGSRSDGQTAVPNCHRVFDDVAKEPGPGNDSVCGTAGIGQIDFFGPQGYAVISPVATWREWETNTDRGLKLTT